MSPRQLIEKLEALGIIDQKVLDKIRKEIDNPEKTVKPKAVLSYLVKKQQITEQQAKQLLLMSAPRTEDEIEVVQPVEKSYDTDDLTGLNQDLAEEEVIEPMVEAAVEPEFGDYGATMIDDGAIARSVDPDIVVSTPEIVAPMLDEEMQEVAPIAYGGLGDDEGFDGGYQSGAHATQSGENKVVASFRGKRNKKDQWATKWLYIGFGILGTLLIGVAVLVVVTMGQSAEDMMQAAMDSFNKGSFADATKKFDEFLEAFPDHKNAPDARGKKVHSILRGTYNLKNYSEVLQQAKTLLPAMEEEGEKLSDLRDDLAVMLPRSLVEVSNKTTKLVDLAAMEQDLVKIKGHFEIVDNPVYIPTSKRKPPSINDNYLKIDNNIRMVQGQIDKEKRYNADLVTIEGLRVTKQTDEAFGIYQKLTRNYGDLASRDELRELMLQISQAEKELVVPVELNITTSTEGKPSVIENTVVLATTSGQPVPGLKEEIVVFLADGAVYGIDAGDGSIVWRRFVGYETHNQPVQIDEETIAVSDQRDHQLLAVDKKTGELQWRTEINEPFLLPTLGEQVLVVTTESGRLLQLDTNSGAVGYSTQLPQPANVSALVATRDPYIYQVGSYQNLYVLSSQDYSCAEVHYLGHYEGSISIPPQAWTGFILVAVNGGDSCDLHVLKPKAKGLGLELVQVISNVVDGTVSVPLQRVGRWMLLTADNGEMKILELFPAEEQNPVRVLTADLFDAKGGQSVYVKAEGSNLWVAGQGIMRYRIQRNLGTIGREVLLEPTDTFISPIQKLDDYLMHVRRRNGSGMISVSLVDAKTLTGPETLKSVWRTDIGGALAGQPMKFGDNVVAVSNQGDTFSIDAVAETSRNAGIPVRGSAVIENLIFSNTVRTSDDTFAVVAPAGRKDFLTGSGSTGRTKLLAFGNPADKPACLPMAIGEHLIVPTQTGQIARVDPSNGRMIGTPFQPPIQAGSSKPQWFEPTMIGNDVFAIGAAATDDGLKSMIYLLDGSSPRVVAKIAELELENSLKSRLVIVGQNLFGVSAGGNADSLISLTAATALTLEGSVEMEGELVDGPWPTDAGILVRLDNDKLYCFGTDLAVKWSIDVSNEKFACSPTQVGAQLMVCFQNGKVNFIDPGTGQVGRIFDLGQPIIHEPLRSGNKMYFGGVDGTVHVVDLNKLP